MSSSAATQAMPQPVVDLLDKALVGELTVLDASGRPRTDPLIPLWDGQHILLTSSVLFSRKLEDIKRNPRVSLSLSDPVGVPVEPFSRATIQGDARVIEDDLHDGWNSVLPLWLKKEPVIAKLLKLRFALPLFWERSVIEITPRRVTWWAAGDTTGQPQVTELNFS
ncbi:MAG TPA: pyridoxamine 5'-phosphate oxidase family protein [Candidatus Dormibacteraeota bacterium]|nr:pyridoxamine 5'-phosphate oxidase family protein [Candidatus Dormibacteraeota bacterium]